jgi:hypothetical protein
LLLRLSVVAKTKSISNIENLIVQSNCDAAIIQQHLNCEDIKLCINFFAFISLMYT